MEELVTQLLQKVVKKSRVKLARKVGKLLKKEKYLLPIFQTILKESNFILETVKQEETDNG